MSLNYNICILITEVLQCTLYIHVCEVLCQSQNYVAKYNYLEKMGKKDLDGIKGVF